MPPQQPKLTPQQRRKHRAGKARLRAKLRQKREESDHRKGEVEREKAWAKLYHLDEP